MKLTVCLLEIELVLLILLLASTYVVFLLSAFVMTVIAKNWTALLFVNYCLMLNFSKPKKQHVSSPSVPRISWLQICGEDFFLCIVSSVLNLRSIYFSKAQDSAGHRWFGGFRKWGSFLGFPFLIEERYNRIISTHLCFFSQGLNYFGGVFFYVNTYSLLCIFASARSWSGTVSLAKCKVPDISLHIFGVYFTDVMSCQFRSP